MEPDIKDRIRRRKLVEYSRRIKHLEKNIYSPLTRPVGDATTKTELEKPKAVRPYHLTSSEKPIVMSMNDPRYLEVLKSTKIKTKRKFSPRKSKHDGIYNALANLRPKQVIGYSCTNKVRIGLSVPENGINSKVIEIDAYNHSLSGRKSCMTRDNVVKRIRYAKENNRGTWKLLDKDKRKHWNGKPSKDVTVTCYQGNCWVARKV